MIVFIQSIPLLKCLAVFLSFIKAIYKTMTLEFSVTRQTVQNVPSGNIRAKCNSDDGLKYGP